MSAADDQGQAVASPADIIARIKESRQKAIGQNDLNTGEPIVTGTDLAQADTITGDPFREPGNESQAPLIFPDLTLENLSAVNNERPVEQPVIQDPITNSIGKRNNITEMDRTDNVGNANKNNDITTPNQDNDLTPPGKDIERVKSFWKARIQPKGGWMKKKSGGSGKDDPRNGKLDYERKEGEGRKSGYEKRDDDDKEVGEGSGGALRREGYEKKEGEGRRSERGTGREGRTKGEITEKTDSGENAGSYHHASRDEPDTPATIEMMLEKVRSVSLVSRGRLNEAFIHDVQGMMEADAKKQSWFSINHKIQAPKGIVALSRSGMIQEFVAKHKGSWTGEEWTMFIAALRKKGFGALEEDIFSLVELERACYHRNN